SRGDEQRMLDAFLKTERRQIDLAANVARECALGDTFDGYFKLDPAERTRAAALEKIGASSLQAELRRVDMRRRLQRIADFHIARDGPTHFDLDPCEAGQRQLDGIRVAVGRRGESHGRRVLAPGTLFQMFETDAADIQNRG